MSLKNILDTARKLGIPVVITNERGESPQVIVPFEDFAAMVGGGAPMHSHAHSENCDCEEEEEDELPMIEEMSHWSADEEGDSAYDLSPKEIEELDKIFIEDEKGGSEKPAAEPTNVSLEDQFYFDPAQEK